jgi:hypothetical protein
VSFADVASVNLKLGDTSQLTVGDDAAVDAAARTIESIPYAGGGDHYTASNTHLGTVRVFGQNCALEDAIGSHACSLEALPCV